MIWSTIINVEFQRLPIYCEVSSHRILPAKNIPNIRAIQLFHIIYRFTSIPILRNCLKARNLWEQIKNSECTARKLMWPWWWYEEQTSITESRILRRHIGKRLPTIIDRLNIFFLSCNREKYVNGIRTSKLLGKEKNNHDVWMDQNLFETCSGNHVKIFRYPFE